MKRLFFGIIFILVVLVQSGTPLAKVSGECSNCHTMHNSQGGTSMATGYGAGAGPYNTLLRVNDCLGCHASTGADKYQSIGDAPVVFNTSAPTYAANGLAAGNFYYVTLDSANGHNVEGISGAEPEATYTPPGQGSGKADIDGLKPGGGSWVADQKVRCAGYYGCHGWHNLDYDTNMKGMKGAHHGDEGAGSYRDGTTLAKSYRFLNGIKGREDSNWEYDTSNTDHNWYQGATDFTTNTTISYLCAECHANYHNGLADMIGEASHWKRHPGDGVLLSETQGSSSYDPTGLYDNNAPVAYTDPANPSNATAVVMCLSCHRAHASPYGSNVPIFRGSTAFAVCNKCHDQ